MLFSYHWLKELSGTKKTPQRLADMLMAHAFEVEAVMPYAHGLSDVIIGKVMTVKPHPNADRLRVAIVSTGKKTIHEIVCGASNLAVGQRVAVAVPGAKLPGGIEIKSAELRGVKSDGMICSAQELGLGDDHAGILVLPPDAPLGKSFSAYAGLEDTVLDVKVLPDRSCDALSYRGMAREIAALEGGIATFLSLTKRPARLRKSAKVPKVTLRTDRAKRYLAIRMDQVTPSPSPLLVLARLSLSGIRPRQAIVDLTNYLMLETGQPVHAFDADAIPKGGIVVRLAKARERLLLLDGTQIALSKDDIVIADTKKPLALAGVMGGKHSAISEKTQRVVFEIASFDAPSIRRTEKRHRLLTDAAYRFERGVDVDRPSEIAELLAIYAEAWGIGHGLTVREVASRPEKPTVILLELAYLERLLGTKLPLFQAVQYCAWLGLTVKKVPNQPVLRVVVPSRRPDLRNPEDLIEEIGRLHGYHTIDPLPLLRPAVPLVRDPAKKFERTVKTTLAAMGFDEVMSYSFYGEKSLALVALPKEEHLAVANPMNPEQAFMRASLFPGLYRALSANAKQSNRLSLFEFGSVHKRGDGGPQEEKHVALAVLTPAGDLAETDFLRFKARVEAFFQSVRVEVVWNELATGTPAAYRSGSVAHLTTRSGHSLGYAGEINPTLSGRLGSGTRSYFAELSVPAVMSETQDTIVYRDFSRFPLAHRDISLIGPKSVSFADLETVLLAAGGSLLVEHELFDVYVAGEEKSFALHLSFGSPERTLS
ncbi:MAG: phenylalanine--tRNA ligase subunit beta, partial [Candidatus Moraniibacteriota bacterium]